MRIIRASKSHNCKKCKSLILAGDEYYPQRHKNAICFDCGVSLNKNSLYNKAKRKLGNRIMGKIYGWLSR